MQNALVLAPLVLAAVLVLSGLAKMRDTTSTHSVLRLLRLPAPLTQRWVARALPWGELAVAALLLTPWWPAYALGAAAALGLFVAFWVVVARAMTFDPRPTCGCFGRIGDHRINARTLWRNTLLVALALVAGWIALRRVAATSLVTDFAGNDWLWLLLAVATATVAVLILGTSGMPSPSRRATRRQAGGPPHEHAGAGQGAEDAQEELDYVRRPVPRGILIGRDGQAVELQTLPRARAQLLILVNCWCGPTHAALDRLPAWREQLPELDVQMVFGPRPFDEGAAPSGVPGIWWDPGHRVYEALEVGASPGAVLLGADGLTAGGPVNGIEEIEAFVADIEAQLAEARDAAPSES